MTSVLCHFFCGVTDEIQKFMEVVKSIGYQDRPPYDRLRSILQTGLKSIQSKDDGKLEFTPVNGTLSSPVKVSRDTHTENFWDVRTLHIMTICTVCIGGPRPTSEFCPSSAMELDFCP